MQELIDALKIFKNYTKFGYTIRSEHDIILIDLWNNRCVSVEDSYKLSQLNFFWSSQYDCWAYKF